ncbi:penicillin-binding transpeptidase domain-containing protein [Paenibacillus sp. IHBB 10380]|uniref:penicillin-binding transpeptidase domain-containing protein n=1 Tax=Paenibacillus sp. IHBB 10380 TaxID=1566358 RepID=UPI0005CFCA37|nr:penicillin-binding transpeptidase domain-containing protein [Paenibacillus sp. IHBB 10380]
MVKKIKLRTLFIGGCITLLFVVLITKIFWIQVVKGDFWHEKAVGSWSREKVIAATRGTITDRKGDALAIDAPAYTVTVNPKVIQENGIEDEVVTELNKILGKPEDELRALVTAKDDKGEEYLTSREVRPEGLMVNQDKKDQIDALVKVMKKKLKDKGKVADAGIGTLSQKKRIYPKNSLAAHILGYTDRDGKAVAGFEAFHDEILKGTPGSSNYKSDGQLDKLPNSDEVYVPAVNGKNVQLTIDSTIQYYIEEAMKEAYEKYKPVSMTVIAADPNTMEILGMANLPTYDPNTYWETPEAENFTNHAVKSLYEPGSTFKIVTLAGAVQEKLFNPNATYVSGQITVQGTKQKLYDVVRSGWGTISYLDGVKHSSNVAFIKLGSEMLGKERLLKYITDFGFGQRTGIELPGETARAINLPGPVEVATASYGYGVQVTPIQQITAIAAVANGGKLMKPHIVKEINDPNTGESKKVLPEMTRQVISAESAKESSGYLEQVVSDQVMGTGRNAYIEGYRVAGKTGTALKWVNNEYSKTKQIISFSGFAPVNDPKIAVIVIMDEPMDGTVGGGKAAAPVFKKIVSQSLQYMNVPKLVTSEQTKEKQPNDKGASGSVSYTTPNMQGKAIVKAKKELLNTGIAFETLGKGKTVINQYPAKGSVMSSGQRIYLLTEENDRMKVPDLKGESLRDALQVLTLMKLTASVEGEGFVTEQKEIKEGNKRKVLLNLSPADEMASHKEEEVDQ